MKNIYKSILMCVVLVMGACTDLDEVLVGEATEPFSESEPSFGTFDGGGAGPSDAIASPFAELRNSGSANHGGYWSIQSVSSDEMAVTQKGGDWYDGGIWIDVHRHTAGPTNGPISDTWNAQYNAIGACNSALGQNSDSDPENDLDANQVAQVRVLRAFFYYRLLDLYGRVKIVTQTGVDAPQSTRAQVFAFVESEIKAALGIAAVTPTLSLTDLSNGDLTGNTSVYRVNYWGALGLLAKLYLNAEVYTGTPRYAEAAWAAGFIIDNGNYILCGSGCVSPNYANRPNVPSDPVNLEGYATVFAPDNFNSPEMIWSIAYDHISGGGMNFSQMTLHYSSQFTWNFQDQPWNGYSALEDFYNSYDAADKRKAANFIVGPQLDYEGSAIIDYAATGGELELDYTPDINELEPNASRKGGARLGKFSYRQGNRNDADNDFPIIRLGDVYLIRAEGLARAAGDWSLAGPDVNTIRARAGLSAMGSITADSFLEERGREMFQEGSRRQDLIRFGKYDDPWWEKSTSAATKSLFPIPQGQIDASNGTLTQNPGY